MTAGAVLFSALLAAAPLWMRVTNRPESDPSFLHVFVRHSAKPHYQHANISTAGLREGPVPQGGKQTRLAPGGSSPWVDLSPVLGNGKGKFLDRFCFSMISRWGEAVTNATFDLEFSTDRKSVLRKIERRGPGSGLYAVLSATSDGVFSVRSDAECVAEEVRRYRELPAVPGRAPERFPMATGFAVNPSVARPEVYEAELKMLRGLGINCANGRAGDFPYRRLTAFGLGPFVHADADTSRAKAAAWREKLRGAAGPSSTLLVNVADEPSVKPEHVKGCAVCAQGVPGGATDDPREGGRYYRSVRHLLDETARSFRTIRESVWTVLPDVPVSVNNGISLVFHGNLARSGIDWFKVYGDGCLTYGWGEDWANFGRTRQINSIYWDAMRAACAPRRLPFGFYDILEHGGWDVQAKAFSAIGRGARQLCFFNYGPWYAISSDQQSRRPEALEAIRRVTFAVGSVEDEICAATCARGDAAILLGLTGDIWMAAEDSEYGMERTALSLLLRHCNVRTDVLDENRVAQDLGRYPLLFVLDRNVRRDVAETILAWVKGGGRLYLGPNALSADEDNRPLDLGIERSPYRKEQEVGRPQFELVKCRELGRFADMRMVVGRCEEPWKDLRVGKGTVHMSGFFPGLDYWGSARTNANSRGLLDYPPAHGRFFKDRVLSGVPIRCETTDPRVEASLLAGSSSCVLVFSNWTGVPAEVGFVVHRAGKAKVRAAAGTRLLKADSVLRDGHLDLEGRVAIGAGGILVLERKGERN